MRAKEASLWLALVWGGGFFSTAVLGQAAEVTTCVTSCLESAASEFERCRDLGGTVSECSREAERDFTACAGDGGCQGAKCRIGADVAGRPLASDVLLSGAERQDVAPLVLRVDRLSDQTTHHSS